MKIISTIFTLALLAAGYSGSVLSEGSGDKAGWQTDFFDDFDSFNADNWQDQMIWVNDEYHCYVTDNQYGTREVSDGSIKLKVINIGEQRSCDNLDKHGKQHPATQYVAGRIVSKNRHEFIQGKWTARLKVDGAEVYRNVGEGDKYPEPMFAILNFAKITGSPMTGEWVMEVDWVKHERWQ